METVNYRGDFTIWTDKAVLLADAKGAWNMSTAVRYAEQIMLQAKKVSSNRWGHIVFLDDWGLGTPEIEPIIINLVQWCINHHMARLALVFNDDTLKQFQLDKMIVSKTSSFERRYFTSRQPALEWLKEEGFPVTE